MKKERHDPQKAFDPLDYTTIAETIVRTLLEQECNPLPPPEPFRGAGIYALYYSGDFGPYESIAARNRGPNPTQPIYIGKTDGSLYKRLEQHAKSIRQTSNLRLEDFKCRYLVVRPEWIGLAEAMLIERFRPPWNGAIRGFGIHDPGEGRRRQKLSDWDALHPGREIAEGLPRGKSEAVILEKLQQFLNRYHSG